MSEYEAAAGVGRREAGNARLRARDHDFPVAEADFDRHDARVVRHAGQQHRVVRVLADRAAHVRAVAVHVQHRTLRLEKREVPRVRQPVRRQVRIDGKRHHDVLERLAGPDPERPGPRRGRDARVEHGDREIRRPARLDVPRGRHVEQPEVPLIAGVIRVVRGDEGAGRRRLHPLAEPGFDARDVVRFREGDLGLLGQLTGERVRVRLRGIAHHAHRAVPLDVAQPRLAAEAGQRALPPRRGHERPEPHDDLAREVVELADGRVYKSLGPGGGETVTRRDRLNPG